MRSEALDENALSGMDFPRLVRVLVVEDDFGDYDAIARALRKMVHFEAAVTRAKTLAAARKLMAEHCYDVFLVDHELGADCGARLLGEIGGRAGGRGVPILLTSQDDREVHEIALGAGAVACIDKRDLSTTLLETTIRYALFTHRLEKGAARLIRALAAVGTSETAEVIAACLESMPWLAKLTGSLSPGISTAGRTKPATTHVVAALQCAAPT